MASIKPVKINTLMAEARHKEVCHAQSFKYSTVITSTPVETVCMKNK